MQLPHPANFMFDQSEVAGVQVHSPVPWLVRLRLDLESDPSREIWHDVAPCSGVSCCRKLTTRLGLSSCRP